MLSEKQKAWLNHLSDTNKVKITPYDPKVKEIFNGQKQEIQSVLGEDAVILHEGASAWGISGKGDIDIYIPVLVTEFNNTFKKLKLSLGEPGSYYQDERVRWNTELDDTEVEIFLVNQDATFWKDSLVFWDYIKSHPETLEEYRKIKEAAEGTSTREYYTRKVEFINKVLEIAKNP
jgi:GrpB-like predicted nucleotidyltransferase (UPF0157 family)